MPKLTAAEIDDGDDLNKDAAIIDRAYSVLEIRSVKEDERVIRGIATTPTPDRLGDIVEPLGVEFKNPLPLLWQHSAKEPVGLVKFDKPTKDGITFEAQLPKIEEPGKLKDRVEEAWQSIKHGLVRGVSIGFKGIETSFMNDGGVRFIKSLVLELSLVTIPANAEATIQQIKAIDHKLLAVSGRAENSPGVSGTIKPKTPKEAKMTLQEQIAAFENKRAAKAARMSDIMNKAAAEGSTLETEESDEYDLLEDEVKKIDEHLKRLAVLEQTNKAAAVPVGQPKSPKEGSEVRAGNGASVVTVRPNCPKGTAYTRYVIALLKANGNLMQAVEIAKQWDSSTPEVVEVLRAAVVAGTTTDSAWAGPLVVYQNMQSELIELLTPLTIIGRIPGLNRVPFKIKVPRQTGGATVNWIGEGKVKPLSQLVLDTVTLEHYKIAGIIPLTEELVRFSNPSAEALVRSSLVKAIVEFMDSEFVDPAKALQAGVSPASITNGVSAVTATGITADALRADIKTLFGLFLAANMNATGAVWIMTQSQALAISLMRNTLGQPEFPGVTIDGGTMVGLPVIASENIPATGGSPADGYPIILAKAPDIMLADDGQVMVDVSREASLQFDSAPDSPATASTNLISLWQHDMVAVRVERFVAWIKARAEAVQYIQNAKYAD